MLYNKISINQQGDNMKRNKIATIALASMLAVSACIGLTACKENKSNSKLPEYPFWLPEEPATQNASVHDPSVFQDPADGKFYAFGSHFAVASSTDLISWRQVASEGAQGQQMLYGTTNWRSVLPLSDALVGGSQNTWAPDVEKIGDTYYMYYSLTSGFGSGRSVIGRVSSDSVTGPYSNEEIIVYSSEKAGEPNAIDPELFYDESGRLWMVYGSFYGGIFLIELDPATGLRKDGRTYRDYQAGKYTLNEYFGKMLWKGGGGGVEGPFIFYDETQGYYYLMVSDGDLSSNYNMLVARSENPDGPYTDIKGNDVAANIGGGNKLAGNYQFAGDQGYAAIGHNSVVQLDGKTLVVAHTRYRSGPDGVSGNHNLRVLEMYFNEDGWPVLSPNAYAGEEPGLVTQAEAAGDYQVVVHTTKRNDATFVDSVPYTFSEDGKILSGTAEAGTWTVISDYYVEIVLNNITYNGVIAPAWISYENAGRLCMTAVSDQGGSIWANQVIGE